MVTLGWARRTSNRITSLRMTAEMRSKSLSYCVTRDSHCGERTRAGPGGGGEEQQLPLPAVPHPQLGVRRCRNRLRAELQPLLAASSGRKPQEVGPRAAPPAASVASCRA